ncbi:stage II sporulation protein R [Paenibacillus durus]|uniref:Stage II sporulation protein R n=1 Tax=Paenibacillus durus ATCC 35681 TaxID=1333534 RepID=A0A0F7FCT8_PAEDU|nr:stage II sporulation protein R [Paenibacillus durus]AKG36610.1 stage II sporulation protein R [Paenibacillus durus ATCC 35681]
MNAKKGIDGDSLRKTFTYTAILICILMFVVMAWEGQKTDAAVSGGPIPKESIRLRILANSDGAQDQLMKRQLRDKIVAQMNGWVAELEDPQSLDQARGVIREHLPELNKLVGNELDKRGIGYGYKVELGVVPFPTKLYGGTVYPAGEYEALRVTLGKGEGQNWWCVLFPPLCFIDAGSGDAAAKPANDAKAKSVKVSANGKGAAAKTKAAQADLSPDRQPDGAVQAEAPAEQPKVRFFVWELLLKIGSWIRGLWA